MYKFIKNNYLNNPRIDITNMIAVNSLAFGDQVTSFDQTCRDIARLRNITINGKNYGNFRGINHFLHALNKAKLPEHFKSYFAAKLNQETLQKVVDQAVSKTFSIKFGHDCFYSAIPHSHTIESFDENIVFYTYKAHIKEKDMNNGRKRIITATPYIITAKITYIPQQRTFKRHISNVTKPELINNETRDYGKLLLKDNEANEVIGHCISCFDKNNKNPKNFSEEMLKIAKDTENLSQYSSTILQMPVAEVKIIKLFLLLENNTQQSTLQKFITENDIIENSIAKFPSLSTFNKIKFYIALNKPDLANDLLTMQIENLTPSEIKHLKQFSNTVKCTSKYFADKVLAATDLQHTQIKYNYQIQLACGDEKEAINSTLGKINEGNMHIKDFRTLKQYCENHNKGEFVDNILKIANGKQSARDLLKIGIIAENLTFCEKALNSITLDNDAIIKNLLQFFNANRNDNQKLIDKVLTNFANVIRRDEIAKFNFNAALNAIQEDSLETFSEIATLPGILPLIIENYKNTDGLELSIREACYNNDLTFTDDDKRKTILRRYLANEDIFKMHFANDRKLIQKLVMDKMIDSTLLQKAPHICETLKTVHNALCDKFRFMLTRNDTNFLDQTTIWAKEGLLTGKTQKAPKQIVRLPEISSESSSSKKMIVIPQEEINENKSLANNLESTRFVTVKNM